MSSSKHAPAKTSAVAAAMDTDASEERDEDESEDNGVSSVAGGAAKKGGAAAARRPRDPDAKPKATVITIGHSLEDITEKFDIVRATMIPEKDFGVNRHARLLKDADKKEIPGSSMELCATFGKMFEHPFFRPALGTTEKPSGDLMCVREKATGKHHLVTLMRTDTEKTADAKKSVFFRFRIPTAAMLLNNPAIKAWCNANRNAILSEDEQPYFMDVEGLYIPEALSERLAADKRSRGTGASAVPPASRRPAAPAVPAVTEIAAAKPAARPRAKPKAAAAVVVDTEAESEDESPPPIVASAPPKPKNAPRIKPAAPSAAPVVSDVQATGNNLVADAILALPKGDTEVTLADYIATVGLRLASDPVKWTANLTKLSGLSDIKPLLTAVSEEKRPLNMSNVALKQFIAESIVMVTAPAGNDDEEETTEPDFASMLTLAVKSAQAAVAMVEHAHADVAARQAIETATRDTSIAALSAENKRLATELEISEQKLLVLAKAAASSALPPAAVAAAAPPATPKNGKTTTSAPVKRPAAVALADDGVDWDS